MSGLFVFGVRSVRGYVRGRNVGPGLVSRCPSVNTQVLSENSIMIAFLFGLKRKRPMEVRASYVSSCDIPARCMRDKGFCETKFSKFSKFCRC